MATDKTGICSICGKEIAISGLKNHEKACAKKNEEAKLSEEEVLEVAEEATNEPEEVIDGSLIDEVEVITKPQPKQELVKIKLANDINCFIGGIRHTYHKGQVVEVPKNVKDILMTAGYLQAI